MRRLIIMFALWGCEAKNESAPEIPSSAPIASDTLSGKSSCDAKIIGEEGIGSLRIGATVDSIRLLCNVLRDTTVLDNEAMPQRELVVRVDADTVRAEIVNGRVWRIAILSPRLHTPDSLGVGSPLAKLLRLKNPRSMTGEGEIFVASPEHCGMSFRLENANEAIYQGELDRAGLARLPASTFVSQVLVFGCKT